MTPSRRQFLTGALALGATPLLAQDEPKTPHTLDIAEEQAKWEALLADEKAKLEAAKVSRDEERIFEKEQWEEERRDNLERLTILNNLERILLSRYMAPVDFWLNHQGYMNIKTFSAVADRLVADDDKVKPIDTVWFLLKITSENKFKGTDIWIKFSVGNSDRKLVWVDDNTDDTADGDSKKQKQVPEEFVDTIWRKRDGLFDTLEHHLAQRMEDEDCKQTMIDGTAHLYQLYGSDQDPDKVMKEQLLA